MRDAELPGTRLRYEDSGGEGSGEQTLIRGQGHNSFP